MTIGIGEIFALLMLSAIIGTIGVALGIFFLAPRISRRLDRQDVNGEGEETGDGDD
ncbi:MAG: hypothetical protein HW391_222 [Chloroflexi bacterium]|nr:hypothetical protein [Chloroflexota bacterium]